MDDLRIPCEGSGCPANHPGYILGLCQMCGALVGLDDDRNIGRHDRPDVLAMLRRGDFDAISLSRHTRQADTAPAVRLLPADLDAAMTDAEDRVRCGLPERDDRPVHVVAKPGDQYSLCGLKDPLPVVASQAVELHVAGHGMVVCAECAAKR